MAGKKHRKTSGKTNKQSDRLSFFFYGKFSNNSAEILEESVKQLRKDFRENSSFYYLKSSDSSVESELVNVIEITEDAVPLKIKDNDYVIFLPVDKLSTKINLNHFFSISREQLPEGETWSRLYFKGRSLSPASIHILGKDLANYIFSLKFSENKNFENQFVWYLERMNAQGPDIIIDHEEPYSIKQSNFFKKTGSLFNGHPFYWNFKRAIKEQREGIGFRTYKEEPIWRTIFSATAIIFLILLPILSYNAALSGDEEKHHLHAVKVYNYFKTDGADTLALNDPKYKLNYYGQSFDLFSYLFIKTFNIEKVYETRHVLNGLAGGLAIITAGILIRYLAGSFAGFITLLFMFFFPRFMGHSMNNPLDIPFALGYIFSIYQMIRFLRKLPEFSLKHAILLSLGIAFTTSIRIGGLILIPYLFMFSGLYLLIKKWPWKTFSSRYFSFAGKGLVYITAISLIAYFLSILPWPYALQDPLKNPLNALDMMANITVSLRVMFEGNIIWSDALPWYYVPKNMYVTIPIIIWIFFVITFLFFFRKKKELNNFWLFTLYFITIFPVLYIIYQESNVYGGWRHTLFIYPSFAGIAAIGVNEIKNLSRSRIYRTVFVSLIILGLYHPVSHTIRNYPLQYIYFNEIAGGVDRAYTKYETDYYLNSLKPGTEWILKNIIPEEEQEDKITIISNAPYDIMHYYYRDHLHKIKFPYTRYYDRGSKNWDYAIYYCNYINPYQLRRNIWPPKNTIHEVKVDDVTVCAIVKRENRKDYLGIQSLNKGLSENDPGTITRGINLLEEAVKYDPNNEIALLSLARGYIMLQRYDQARSTLGSLLEIYPDYDKALNLMAFSFISEGDVSRKPALFDRAVNILIKVININHKFSDGYYNLGLAFYLKGDDNRAMNYLNRAIEINHRHRKSYYLIATILEQNGDTAQAQQVLNYVNSLR